MTSWLLTFSLHISHPHDFMRYFLTYHEIVCLKNKKKMLNGKVKFWTDLKYFEISIFRCSFADLKNDAIRELSHQIIIFASFVHHCDFRFVRKQFFEEKNWKKNHWRQKTSEFIFVWKKNCYEFALHQDLPSQSLAQELPKKELKRKKVSEVIHNMEKIQILSEIVDNRSFVKMSKGKRNRTYRNRNKNKEKQKNSMLKSFNYAENVPKEIWMKVFFYCDQISLDNLKMTCVAFYNIIDSNAAQYGISSFFNYYFFFQITARSSVTS